MKTPKSLPLVSFFAACVLGIQPALAVEGMLGVHDPSTVATCDGKYYVFGTGRGIPILSSTNGFDWQRVGKVFERIPEAVKAYVPRNDGVDVWAPDVIKLNEQYYLYYSISKWGEYVSAVGLMTNPTLDPQAPNYQWTDRGMVVHSIEGQHLNSIDPGVLHGPDGKLWICYGSYLGNIELVELNPQTGLRVAPDSPVSIIASHSEAADLIHHDGYYYLFVNHGSCCAGVNSTYHIRVGRSKTPTGPYLDKQGDDLVTGAGSLFLASAGKQVGPGHFGRFVADGVEKFSIHYEGQLESFGRSFLAIRPLLWTTDGWPMAGEDVTAGTYQLCSQRKGEVLQVAPKATDNNRLETAPYLIRNHQQWTLTPAGGGCYRLTSATGNTVLQAVPPESNDGKARGGLVMAPSAANEQQLWTIDQLTDGSYRIASKIGHLVVTTPTGPRSGNGLVLEPFTGTAAQRWIISPP